MNVQIKLIGLLILIAAAVILPGLRGAVAQDVPADPPTTAPAVAEPATAKPAIEKPTGPIEPAGCVTAACHADVKQFKVLHGPVNVNACEACHQPVDVEQHTFKLTQEKTELCLFCHQIEQPAGSTVHEPVKQGECLSCHNPHGGATSAFIQPGGMRQVCSQCHEDVIGTKKSIHGPAAAGACEACHKPHVSEFDHLLVMENGRDLCFSCHAEMKTQMAQVEFTHEAVEQDCSSCHDPHASDFTMQIKQKPLDLCISCHGDVGKMATEATHKHGVVVEGEACLNCHTAHGSDLASLMKREPLQVCMSCHAEPIKGETRTVAAVAEVLEPQAVKHGPIRDGNCSGCHSTHGAEIARLLNKEYPEAFYQDFERKRYDLCFSCHDEQLVLTPKTTGLTGFRNGSANLHFLHVNKSERGRNCRACHQTHASSNELHVRDSVPFGNWQMPINFARRETGGSCSPGCHKAYEYDRDKPVSYDGSAPTTAPAAR